MRTPTAVPDDDIAKRLEGPSSHLSRSLRPRDPYDSPTRDLEVVVG